MSDSLGTLEAVSMDLTSNGGMIAKESSSAMLSSDSCSKNIHETLFDEIASTAAAR